MPIFDYFCNECSELALDVLVRRYDDVVTCEVCSSIMSKRPSIPAIKNLNTREKISNALRTRSLKHSAKNAEAAAYHSNKSKK